MQALEIPVLSGEFIPSGTVFNIPLVPKGSAHDLLVLYKSESARLVKDTIERASWLGDMIIEAESRLYTETTGKRLSQETNERRGQIASISKEWNALLGVLDISAETAKRVKLASRDPQKYAARLEVKREHMAEQRQTGGKGVVPPLPSQPAERSEEKREVITNVTRPSGTIADAVAGSDRPVMYWKMVEEFRDAIKLLDKIDDSNIDLGRQLAAKLKDNLRQLAKGK